MPFPCGVLQLLTGLDYYNPLTCTKERPGRVACALFSPCRPSSNRLGISFKSPSNLLGICFKSPSNRSGLSWHPSEQVLDGTAEKGLGQSRAAAQELPVLAGTVTGIVPASWIMLPDSPHNPAQYLGVAGFRALGFWVLGFHGLNPQPRTEQRSQLTAGWFIN